MNCKKSIILRPVEMTKEVMNLLEAKGLIIRLCPGHHELKTKVGDTDVVCIYSSAKEYGTHKLIGVTVNRTTMPFFGAHPDNEEFILLGDPAVKPMYLVIALCMKDELDMKIKTGTVSDEDFITLKVKYNDPEVSFFTMLKDVPHGECVAEVTGRPASFYVTESADIGIIITDMRGYEFKVECK